MRLGRGGEGGTLAAAAACCGCGSEVPGFWAALDAADGVAEAAVMVPGDGCRLARPPAQHRQMRY